jgi:hypothetical protein
VRRVAAFWNACIKFYTDVLEMIGLGPYSAAFDGKGDNDGVRLIALERVRQVMEKGYDAKHDDQHTDGAIAEAAGCILIDLAGGTHITDLELEHDDDATWPERLAAHVLRKYGEDPVRRLSIAGALIAAEIDRLRRLETPAAPANTLPMSESLDGDVRMVPVMGKVD